MSLHHGKKLIQRHHLSRHELGRGIGRSTQALVPQVYARMKAGDLDGTGTLLAGQVTNLNLSGDISNTGTVAGRTIVNLTAENVNNLGGRISGNAVAITARNDLNNIGGTIDAANSLTAIAGRDLNIASTTSSAGNYTEGTTVNHFSLTGIDRIAGLYVTSQSGTTLVASAGRDANIVAGVIANNGSTGNTTVIAQRDVNLGTVGTSSSSSLVRGVGTDFLEDRQTADVGSQINAQGNLNLSAGRDLNAKAATVQAAGDLTAVAGNNITGCACFLSFVASEETPQPALLTRASPAEPACPSCCATGMSSSLYRFCTSGVQSRLTIWPGLPSTTQ
jgi:filamentous hemagglutinin